MNEEGTVKRITPQSGLDMNMMLTDTMWGSQQISTQISNKVRNRSRDPEASKSAAWDLLSFYTRDFRLANLNAALGEVGYCQHYIDLAGDCLREGYMESFAASLGRGATVLELSQSKSGFLRRRQNTLTTENWTGEIDRKKKSLVFGAKNKNR